MKTNRNIRILSFCLATVIAFVGMTRVIGSDLIVRADQTDDQIEDQTSAWKYVDPFWITIDSNGTTCTVVGSNSGQFAYNSNVVVPGEVNIEGKTYQVKTIAKQSLSEINFASITICEGVEVIEDRAFEKGDCYGTLSLPSTLKSIGAYAFQYAASLKSVTIPQNVKSVGSKAFFYCMNCDVTYYSTTTVASDSFEMCKSVTKLQPGTPDPQPGNPDPQPGTPEPQPGTPEPQPGTPEPQPVVPEPQPYVPPVIPGNPDNGTFADFIERLYVVALNRQSEESGKAFWMNKVMNEGFTGGDCARGFLIEAQEFKNRGLTDEHFVEVLYATFFNREPDADGKAFWSGKLSSGMSRDAVVNGFIDSVEWCNLCARYGIKSGAPNAKATTPSANALKFATRLYTECLGRTPDEDGLQFWALRLTNLESSGYEAARDFFESKEFQNKNVNDETYVKLLYRTFMGRDFDQGGLEFWLGHLSTDMTRLQVLQGFAQSQEFTNICNEYGIERGNI